MPVSVPPDWVKKPLNCESPLKVRVPPEIVTGPLAMSVLRVTVPLEITIGPETTGINTSSVATGTTPVLQFAAVFQLPPAGLIHSTENC